MKKIVLFTGAGMSVPMGLPAAKGFAETIKKCDPSLLSFFNDFLGNGADDIEKILYTVDEFVNGSRFVKYIIQRHSSNVNFQQVNNTLNIHLNSAVAFDRRVKTDIFTILQDFNRDIANSIYINLLKSYERRYTNFSLSIFTTNYDLIFETVYEGDELEKLGYKDVYYGDVDHTVPGQVDHRVS